MTKEEEKLKQCRYYHGEENLNQDESMFWFYEQCWVERGEPDKRTIEEYIAYGLEHFSKNDGVDITFKA